MTAALKDRLVARALEEGFSKVGICAPDAVPEAAGRLSDWLAEGRHGQMGWMEDRAEWRGSAAALWPQARSVIMLAEVYTPEGDPLAVLGQPDRAGISAYAQGRDYHDLVKRRLKRLGRWLIDAAGGRSRSSSTPRR
jgi:epoxyqueuosine reductase